jgi:hypothetical protein
MVVLSTLIYTTGHDVAVSLISTDIRCNVKELLVMTKTVSQPGRFVTAAFIEEPKF